MSAAPTGQRSNKYHQNLLCTRERSFLLLLCKANLGMHQTSEKWEYLLFPTCKFLPSTKLNKIMNLSKKIQMMTMLGPNLWRLATTAHQVKMISLPGNAKQTFLGLLSSEKLFHPMWHICSAHTSHCALLRITANEMHSHVRKLIKRINYLRTLLVIYARKKRD